MHQVGPEVDHHHLAREAPRAQRAAVHRRQLEVDLGAGGRRLRGRASRRSEPAVLAAQQEEGSDSGGRQNGTPGAERAERVVVIMAR